MTGTGSIEKVGIVGAGLVGSGWTVVFALAGLQVRVFDRDPDIRGQVTDFAARTMADMAAVGLASDIDAALARITLCNTMAEAVSDADYVQESAFERVDVKTEVSAQIGALIRRDAIVGSSSSGIPASAFTEASPNRDRFLIVHPVNPPHIVPVVELVPAPWTAQDVVPTVRAFMERIGQVPVVVTREIEGFLLNRLQGALLNEAFALLEEGYASAADIDATVSYGLGLRWSFMGPFETIDLNAPGGLDDYARRLEPLYRSVAQSRREPRGWSDELVQKANMERRQLLPKGELPARRDWRDRMLMQLVSHLRRSRATHT
ncbi:MAG: 3-hydroxyacyl-CoA dehydrogenase [Microvirga sp.]|jgi:3-hydroxyacyl-CoA dehydrogenase|nr:3-hydroxyacyl-CoA dehydrogenase [Microvirga sp.]